MIIGVDARPLSYRLTGIGYYLMYLLKALQEMDRRNIYVLVSNKRIAFDCHRKNWRKAEGHMGARFFSTFWMQVFAPYLARRYRMDLFWGPRHHLPLLLPRRVKTVVTIHDLVHRRCPETMAMENLLVERLFMERSIRKSDAVITVSRSTASDIRYFYRAAAGKVHTVYPGIPEFGSHPRGACPDNSVGSLPGKYFLFVGTLEPRKNLVNVLQAFEQVAETQKEVHLVVAGNIGWQPGKWLPGLMRSRARQRILLTGYVSRSALKHLYENALCLLFPSRYEGFGMPILEAMAAGIPIITSNLSAMAEVAGDAALTVNPENPSDIAGAMSNILLCRDLRNRLLENARARRKEFSWEACARKTLEIFERIYAH